MVRRRLLLFIRLTELFLYSKTALAVVLTLPAVSVALAAWHRLCGCIAVLAGSDASF
jgi:hypothetical protein